MKKYVSLAIIIIIACLLAGCSLSGGGSAKDGFPYDQLESDSVKSRDDTASLSLEGDKLGELLSRMEEPPQYTWTSRVVYQYGETSETYTVIKQVSGGRMRCDKYTPEGAALMHSICDGSSLYVFDAQTGESLMRESFDGDYLGSTVSLPDPALILKGGASGSVSDISFGYVGDDAVISFTYSEPEFSLTEEYAIRASDGIPLKVESRLYDRMVYTLETVDITYAVDDESVFSMPR